MAKRYQKWQVGDVFTVQLKDGRHTVGQALAIEPRVLGAVAIALFDCPVASQEAAGTLTDLSTDKIFSVLFTTRDLLDRGQWRVVNHRTERIPMKLMPYEHLRNSGFVGAKVIGSGYVVDFLNAFYGLVPWDDWKDPNYLDKLLISPEKKPANLIYKNG